MNCHNQTPYTYLIGWKGLDTWYYGARSANKKSPEEDLFIVYYTSSKKVKAFIKKNGIPDVIRIHRKFDSKVDAETHEAKFLTRVGARDSNRWLNQSNNTFPHVRYVRTQEHRDKISQSKKGKPLSEETKRKLSESHRRRYENGAPGNNKNRKLSGDWRENIAKSMIGKPGRRLGVKGKPMSEETKKKISITNKGKPKPPQSEETKLKRSATLKGKKKSNEWRLAISTALLRHYRGDV